MTMTSSMEVLSALILTWMEETLDPATDSIILIEIDQVRIFFLYTSKNTRFVFTKNFCPPTILHHLLLFFCISKVMTMK